MNAEIKSIMALARSFNGGLIIIGKRKEAKEWFYLNDYDNWNKFDDSNQMQDPKVYVSFSAALKKAEKMDIEYKDFEVDITFWIHPDYNVPIEKYQKMTGIRYTGSPRK